MQKQSVCLGDFVQCLLSCQSDILHNSKIHLEWATRNKGRSLGRVPSVPSLADMSLLKMHFACVIPLQGDSKIRLDKSASCHIKTRKIQGQVYIFFLFFSAAFQIFFILLHFFTVFLPHEAAQSTLESKVVSGVLVQQRIISGLVELASLSIILLTDRVSDI